eukprot:2977929-Rhodomonas_salina.1
MRCAESPNVGCTRHACPRTPAPAQFPAPDMGQFSTCTSQTWAGLVVHYSGHGAFSCFCALDMCHIGIPHEAGH